MPPVMGATAFVMASFLGLPYAQIALAALVPSLLFYFGLFVQIDGYAARRGLKGLPRAELPSIGETFAAGWQYIFVLALLVDAAGAAAGSDRPVLRDGLAAGDQPGLAPLSARLEKAGQSRRRHLRRARGTRRCSPAWA